MNTETFWTYTLFGTIATLILGFLGNCTAGCTVFVNPEYAQFEERSKAFKKFWDQRHLLEKQRAIEEALAGQTEIEKIADADTRAMVADLKTFLTGKAPKSTWFEHDLFSRFEDSGRGTNWHWCQKGAACVIRYDLAMLDEHDRITSVAAGDASKIVQLPQVPDEFKNAPRLAPGTPELLVPEWWKWFLWVALSLVFFATWTIVYTGPQFKEKDSHPFDTAPGFLFGWLVIAAAAPGYLIIQLMRVDVFRIGAIGRWIKDKIFPVKFADEYQKFEAQLAAMREKARAQNNGDLLREIETLSARVKETQNKVQLKSMNDALEQIGCYLDAIKEVRLT